MVQEDKERGDRMCNIGQHACIGRPWYSMDQNGFAN